MREIKFRAWDGKRMHILNLYQTQDYNNDFVLREDNSESWIDDICNEVIWPIMQYTGISDKNAIEIYEGDICNSSYFSKSVVVFWNNGWYFRTDKNNHHTFITASHTFEVIGNIYEHKHLLNG